MKIRELAVTNNKIIKSIIRQMFTWFNENDIEVEKTNFRRPNYIRVTFTYKEFQPLDVQNLIHNKIKELIQQLDTKNSLYITSGKGHLEVNTSQEGYGVNLVIDSDGDALMFYLDNEYES